MNIRNSLLSSSCSVESYPFRTPNPSRKAWVLGGANGLEFYFWFDDNGHLCANGPDEARADIEDFLDRYRVLLNDDRLAEFLDKVKPLGPGYLSIKKVAVFCLMNEAAGLLPEEQAEMLPLTPDEIESRVKMLRELYGWNPEMH